MKREGLLTSVLSKYLLVVMLVLIPLGCSKNKDQNTPLTSATPDIFTITPANAQVIKGGTLQFAQKGGVGAISWNVSDPALATINPSTSTLVAGASTGTLTVTAIDASGRKASTPVNIVETKIALSPATLTMSELGPQTAAFTAVGASGTITYTLTGNTGGYTGASLSSSGVLTITKWPTPSQGTQILTVTASEGTLKPATATVTLPTTTDTKTTKITTSPATLTLSQFGQQTATFTATGSSGTVTYNLTGHTNGYTGASITTGKVTTIENSVTGVTTILKSTDGDFTVKTWPTAAQGSQTLTVTASDGALTPGTAMVILPVTETKATAITLSPPTLTMSQFGQQSATFAASGSSGTVTYNLAGNTNGYKGASLSSSGTLTVVTWPTPGQGTQTLTVTASDGALTPGTATVTLPAPTSMSVLPANITLGLLTNATSITYTVDPSSSTAVYNLTGETNGYIGAKIAGSTGVLTLTTSPAAAQGNQVLTITATDGAVAATTTLTLTVN